MPTFLRIDETPTEQENDRIVEEDETLRIHLTLIHTGFDLLPVLCRYVEYKNDAELAFVRLAVRTFNSASAALKLARSGYYQPSLSMIRDVVEIQFLVDLFQREPEELSKWASLPAKEREKLFKPVHVRDKLDRLDGFEEKQRARAYKLFCEYGAHPTPEGFRVISPGGMTQMGPFSGEQPLGACIEELAKHFPLVCLFFSSKMESDDLEFLNAKDRFMTTYQAWKNRFYGSSAEAQEG